MTQDQDFYIPERGAAAYFERGWADHIDPEDVTFAFAPYPPQLLPGDHSARAAELLASALGDISPETLLEIGASVGRTFYEVARRVPTLRRALLVEPSENLRGVYSRVFDAPQPQTHGMLLGNGLRQTVPLDATSIQDHVAHIERELLPETFAELAERAPQADVVVCLNVVDQVHDPWALLALLARATAPGGHLLVSCTYQWQARFLKTGAPPPSNLRHAFASGWTCAQEAELFFQGRVNERFWKTFLSHTLVMRRDLPTSGPPSA